jgi:beta-lactamase superfamily II metal-dependent hydrolase
MKFALVFFLLFVAAAPSYGRDPAADEELAQFMRMLINKELEYSFEEKNEINEAATLPPANGDLNIYALPIGQGDCTVIQCPTIYGGEISIIDFGSSRSTGWSRAQAVAYLAGQTIDKVILTHPDKDHINILEDLLQPLPAYPPIIHSCPWTKYAKYFRKLHSHLLAHYQLHRCCSCGKLSICNGRVDLNFKASGLNNCPRGGSNGDSIVTQIQYAGREVLISGDFEGNRGFITNFLNCAGSIKSDVYKLSHHGAGNGRANTVPYLNAVKPKMAFVSAGFHSTYKHPRCTVIDYLKIHSLTTTGIPMHAYSCYHSGVRTPVTLTTNKAIYTTGVMSGRYVKNYVIRFAIDSYGTITPTEIRV